MGAASPSLSDPRSSHFSQASLLGGSSSKTDALPVFQDALERIAEACIPRVEKIAGEGMPITCTLVSVTKETAGDVMGSIEPGAITAFFDLPAAQTRLLVGLEDPLLQLVIELMCGGMCSEAVSDAPRPGTSIDRQFARVMLNLLSTVIEKECYAFGLGSVVFGQIEAKIDPNALGKRNAAISVATFTLGCLTRSASFRIGFPQAAVERFKQDALPATKDVAVVDPQWTHRFQAELKRTEVTLEAFLEADKLTLGDVATLKIGQIIPLPPAATSRCELRCDEKLLFRCELGQAEGHYSLRIDEALPRTPPSEAAAAADPLSFFNLS